MTRTATTFRVQGLDVHVEGGDAAAPTIVMVHGWPDTCRLWDSTVDALRDRYRCVRFTLPGFDTALPPRTPTLDEMVRLFLAVVDAVAPGQPVTLLLHDWGCVFGYEFAARHPRRVARIVGVDIGDHNAPALRRSLSAKARWQVFGYQVWLAVAWKLGGSLGNRMSRRMARAMRCPTDPAAIDCRMNYPYAMQWFGSAGGLRNALPVEPHCPMLYVYGRRKLFMFHSPQWLQRMAERPGCAVQAMATGHWVMVDQPEAFNGAVAAWLEGAGRPG